MDIKKLTINQKLAVIGLVVAVMGTIVVPLFIFIFQQLNSLNEKQTQLNVDLKTIEAEVAKIKELYTKKLLNLRKNEHGEEDSA